MSDTSTFLLFLYPLNGLLMIGIGVGWGVMLAWRKKLSWRLYGIGMVSFIVSQVVHIPLLMILTEMFKRGVLPTPPPAYSLLFDAVLLGFLAGLCEGLARYAMTRWWAKDARSWSAALMLGAGHGGVEAIIFGGLVLLAFVQMVALRGVDLSAAVPAEQLATAQQQVAAYWGAPWYTIMLGALERFLTLPIQVAMWVLVMRGFTHHQRRWLPLAILAHACVDGVVVCVMGLWGMYVTEAVVALFSLGCVAIILALRQPDPPSPLPPSAPPITPLTADALTPLSEADASLDDSRYA